MPHFDATKMTPTQEQAKRQKWADHVRLRKNPQKNCLGCGGLFPNTREYFSTNPSGRLLGRCHECAVAKPKAGPVDGVCPCCRISGKLVIDRAAPQSVAICRNCLRAVNHVLALDKPAQERLSMYMGWREEKGFPAVPVSGELMEKAPVTDT